MQENIINLINNLIIKSKVNFDPISSLNLLQDEFNELIKWTTKLKNYNSDTNILEFKLQFVDTLISLFIIAKIYDINENDIIKIIELQSRNYNFLIKGE